MPLANISELSTGSQFPPERERSRYQEMNKHFEFTKRKYLNQANDENAGKRRLQPNIYRFLSEFWKDTVVADAPVFNYEGNPRIEQGLEALAPALVTASERVVEDMIIYGVGCFLNRNAFQPQVIDPRYWYPVRDPSDESVGDTDIVAYTYRAAPFGTADHVVVMVFENGTLTRRIHTLDGLTIGGVTETIEELAGIPAVVPVRLGPGFYGTSDFLDAEEYVNDLHRRESKVSEALDRQANPHLAMPEAAMSVNSQGQAVVDIDGMVIPVPENQQTPPKYVVWNAAFDAQHAAIKRDEDRILKFSKISPILVDPEVKLGAISGTALRRMALPTVQKIKNIRQSLTEGLKDTIIAQFDLLARTGGEVFPIERDAISITWPVELSGGITDEADELAKLVGAGLIDVPTMIQLLARVSAEDANRISEQNNGTE